MKPRGSDNLFKMRIGGETPNHVWIDYGNGKTHDWLGMGLGPTLRVLTTDPIERLDLRCVVGLDVILEPFGWDNKASELYERLQQYAATIYVVSLSFEPEMGWAWHKRYGRRELGELAFINRLVEAQSDCIKWASKRNEAKYDEAQARELKILEDAPWLKQ